jgi:hypothetical protein
LVKLFAAIPFASIRSRTKGVTAVSVKAKLETAIRDLCKTAKDETLYDTLSMLADDNETEAGLKDIVLAEIKRRKLKT